jgi:hypothetical protein
MLCGADLFDGQQCRTDVQGVLDHPGRLVGTGDQRGRRPCQFDRRLRAGQVERLQRCARHPVGRRVDRVQPRAVGSVGGDQEHVGRAGVDHLRQRPGQCVALGGDRNGARTEHAGALPDRERGGPGALDEIGQQAVTCRPRRRGDQCGNGEVHRPEQWPARQRGAELLDRHRLIHQVAARAAV